MTACLWPAPITLTGQHVTLAPLAPEHAADLSIAAASLPGLWYTSIPEPEEVSAEISRRNSLENMLPFAVLTPEGRAVGMTTYMNIDAANRRVEIGSTWYGTSVQRSGLNTEAKRMLLAHAFETLSCIAVEFRTHFMNHQSRAAIERLGAKPDGVLRNHMISPDGSLRDTAVYSICAHEWPATKAHLSQRLTWHS